jgi:ubiquinone/menaquinone biosynthesis C-methylase UbiE
LGSGVRATRRFTSAAAKRVKGLPRVGVSSRRRSRQSATGPRAPYLQSRCLVLDVLAPLSQRIIAVDRSGAQLARVAQRVGSRGFHHVSLFEGSYDDSALVERVDVAGGADLVFASRSLHHASRPAQAVRSLARLLKRGGHLVVLDDLPHDIMRKQGDVWLGFADAEVRRLLVEAQLTVLAGVPIPAAFHPDGPDASLTWHAWVAQKPPSSRAVTCAATPTVLQSTQYLSRSPERQPWIGRRRSPRTR